ncbi:MAG: TlpA family protein disulfide reductase [Nitrospinaceae bacterium]|nr:TlpA family protein disulfide reductase [Nitrospinaceae bacterium]NIR56347.1 TlpA family protein disulfide reductase [Nitrospinaceae bacterium]NIS86807.1 TlpA family protein disulfide reductase [Nitrospinaceae bacterium]NIT83641.1 TlpA family protein disulfide reductase [Nitrospinaceae bacterium]NIU45844.1 TlpA family protein disulfide reductase [Nitrospinaceae bacterium]
MPAVNEPAANLEVAEWFQGEPSNIDQQRGKVILIEVFQVNCPGCFIGGLPEAIQTYMAFKGRPLVVWGLATAFEDYHLNSYENLKRLIDTGEVVGQTQAFLSERDMLSMGRLQYFMPFPVAWDKVVKREGGVREGEVQAMIERDFPGWETMPEAHRSQLENQIRAYYERKEYDALTFDRYGLRGTPSSIIIDKEGRVRHKLFGSGLGLEKLVEPLLDE